MLALQLTQHQPEEISYLSSRDRFLILFPLLISTQTASRSNPGVLSCLLSWLP